MNGEFICVTVVVVDNFRSVLEHILEEPSPALTIALENLGKSNIRIASHH